MVVVRDGSVGNVRSTRREFPVDVGAARCPEAVVHSAALLSAVLMRNEYARGGIDAKDGIVVKVECRAGEQTPFRMDNTPGRLAAIATHRDSIGLSTDWAMQRSICS